MIETLQIDKYEPSFGRGLGKLKLSQVIIKIMNELIISP